MKTRVNGACPIRVCLSHDRNGAVARLPRSPAWPYRPPKLMKTSVNGVCPIRVCLSRVCLSHDREC